MDRFTVMTFNIRHDEEADDDHAWLHRRAIALATIRAHSPDLMGLQEPSAPQWADISSALHGWLPFGITGSDSNGAEVEPQGGFIRENRFHLLDSGQFWLSDMPAVPNSVSWPNDCGPRSCAWVRLRDPRGDRDLVFATIAGC